ncbi:hypothetical protein DIZ81_12440 [Legionella taurinensis]|uniref:Thioesterase domain-containing protein n=1 Tax=Legionella taurinensis TaxID=70611 RepID=A0A3A5LN62_9GAMM|nr:hypothetical protein [Legionella taurinensis]MDX1838653.1 hypothetical protein [Legionella taurinensis]PUT38838.1 hypothetical protein DB744_12785 [Legionella taurinensis]PUT40164.1 hypothetical protein DB746_11850 [Legionella taurinensis]PUT42470.1 hypothetical protein DB743_12335 [Legionella taurinensis]PUT45890.1 hypothetical protein DB745_12245 [Legionella taurinensis]
MNRNNRKKNRHAIFSVGLLLATLSLAGCLDLATTRSTIAGKSNESNQAARVYVMRGGLGGIFSTGMNQLQATLEKKHHIKTESTVWFRSSELGRSIVQQYRAGHLHPPVILVGHSLGANDQIKVARILNAANIPVALLITVDAVSPLAVPPNVKHVINLYKPSFVPMFSGLRVKAADPRYTQVDNIDVTTLKNVGVNHFTIEKNKEIQQLMLNNILAVMHKSQKTRQH